jgi:nucleotide-binding universal stress UspA family protein
MPALGGAAGPPYHRPGMDSAPTYLVIVDDSPESRVAMHFAVQRAAHVGASVCLAHVVRPAEFMHFGAVQSAMAAEAREEAAALLASAADAAEALAGQRPATLVLEGEAAPAILAHVRGNPSVRALVLGAASRGAPGQLITAFTGEGAGQLPCLVMVVPGGLDAARLAEIS